MLRMWSKLRGAPVSPPQQEQTPRDTCMLPSLLPAACRERPHISVQGRVNWRGQAGETVFFWLHAHTRKPNPLLSDPWLCSCCSQGSPPRTVLHSHPWEPSTVLQSSARAPQSPCCPRAGVPRAPSPPGLVPTALGYGRQGGSPQPYGWQQF